MKLRRTELLWLATPIPARLGITLAGLGLALTCLVALAFLSGCATPPEGVQITVSEAKAAQCLQAGGCGLLTLAQVRAMLQKAHDEGAAEALADLDSHGCRRGTYGFNGTPPT